MTEAKGIALLISAMLILAGGYALAQDVQDAPGLPVAAEDGFRAGAANPASVGVGNASGLALELGGAFSEDNGDLDDTTWSLYLNSETTSYRLQRTPDGFRNLLALGFEAVPSLYIGSGFRLSGNKWSDGTLDVGLLFRATPFLSVGTRGSLRQLSDPAARVGVGFRPFALGGGDWGSRLTFNADGSFDENGVESVDFGVKAEPLDGLEFEFQYRPETSGFRGSVSFNLIHARSGGVVNGGTDSKGIESAGAFVHVSPKEFRSSLPAAKRQFVEYEPGPNIVDEMPYASFEFLEPRDTATIYEVIRQIERLAEEERVAGIVFRNHNFRTSFANMLELRDALMRFKEADKKVVFYYESVGNANYALAASVADRIYLNPAGSVNLTGLASVRPYVDTFLEKLGLDVVNLTVGEYKSAGNPLSEAGMPPPEREALSALLDDQYETFLGLIEEGRGDRLSAEAAALVDDGPYLRASRAKEAGLVDALIYEDQLTDKLTELQTGAELRPARFPDRIRYDWSTPQTLRIGLITAVGPIHRGEAESGFSIGSDTMVRALKRAREDATIDAVLLRIDSGGGSALASDIIAREVERLSQEKPVVVSVGGTAASGGYYIATPANAIYAQPVSVTGSIGVVALFPNFAGLSEKAGINWSRILRGEHADFAAPYRELTEDERDRVQQGLQDTYERFVETVADQRSLATDQVRESAEGRIWSGSQAADRKLIDDTGGWYDALEDIRDRFPAADRVDLVRVHGQEGFWYGASVTELMRAAVEPELPAGLTELLSTARTIEKLETATPLYLMPYEVNTAR